LHPSDPLNLGNISGVLEPGLSERANVTVLKYRLSSLLCRVRKRCERGGGKVESDIKEGSNEGLCTDADRGTGADDGAEATAVVGGRAEVDEVDEVVAVDVEANTKVDVEMVVAVD
jgi:hypothetical protein